MNPVTETGLPANLVPAQPQPQPESPEARKLVVSQLTSQQSSHSQVGAKSLSERTVDPANTFHFFNEERYIEKFYVERTYHQESYVEKNAGVRKLQVIPFGLNGVKHYKVSPDFPVLEKDFSVSLPLFEAVNLDPYYCEQVKKRLSNIFTHGFENVCKTLCFFENEESVVNGFCHEFVNYLAFGMDKQKGQSFDGWYEKLPFVSIQKFDQEQIQWGDVVQFLSGERLIHSLFYIGDGRYISKHGECDIFFQSLSAAHASYPSDSARIVRLLPEYHSKKIPFKESY